MEMANFQTPKQKKTKGRQKIEIKPIKVQSNLQVTFSKRRSGLVKKASELSLLCGAHVALVTFSPGNKAFAFGHPDVDTVLDRFLSENFDEHNWEAAADSTNIARIATGNPQVQQWNKQYEDALKELEEERKRKVTIEARGKVGEEGSSVNGGFWWDEPIDHLGLEELEEYARALHELKRNVSARANELTMANHFDVEQIIAINGGGSGVACSSGTGVRNSGGVDVDLGAWVDSYNFEDGLFK